MTIHQYIIFDVNDYNEILLLSWII